MKGIDCNKYSRKTETKNSNFGDTNLVLHMGQTIANICHLQSQIVQFKSCSLFNFN